MKNIQKTALPSIRFGRAVFGFSTLTPVVAAGLFLVFSALIAGLVWHWHEPASPGAVHGTLRADDGVATSPDEASIPAEIFYRDIDGVGLPVKAEERPYFAVMIDNLTDARPQSGLSLASVVYEAPVEAGITRFMAVYPASVAVSEVGPVRSARPYFIDWASEYDAVYAHVGGSPAALDRLKRGGEVHDLNEFWNGDVFWRDRTRLAPHNAYTSSERLAKYAARRGFETRPLLPWTFKGDADAADRPESGGMDVSARYEAYASHWLYDPEANDYVRRQGTAPHIDELDGSQIRAKNVLVQFAAVTVLDDVGRRHIVTEGEGDALMAVDGNVYRGAWRKGDDGRTRFYDLSGNEIRLNRGLTWVIIIPVGTEVTY